MCKYIVTPYGEKPRLCKVKDFADGWCHYHHPDKLEEDLISGILSEVRAKQKVENGAVGAWIRCKHPDIFERMRVELEEFSVNDDPYCSRQVWLERLRNFRATR